MIPGVDDGRATRAALSVPRGLTRRAVLAGAALPLLGCRDAADVAGIAGGFTGTHPERGHLLRAGAGAGPHAARGRPVPSATNTTRVVIAGGGVAGLAAARALRLRGIDDFVLLDLEDSAGGNSRAGALGGIACPLGAHYLPLPGDAAHEVQGLLEELGLRQRIAGRWTYDERHLCHSPQERLFFEGQWQDGLLPVQGVGAATIAQYRRFSALVEHAERAAEFTVPLSTGPVPPSHRALDAITFEAWLVRNQLSDRHLRWYLDYCCRDDYGAGIGSVSAWAGLQYFASRHGFQAPDEPGESGEPGKPDAVLTWPEGNGWLTSRLARPLGERLQTGRVVLRVATGKHGIEVDAFNVRTQAVDRWQAQHCILALPLFVAARVVENPPPALSEAAAALRYAPWLVANIHIRSPLYDRPGAAPSWDNVIHGDGRQGAAEGLGYVDAMHQSLGPVPGATVLTWYQAFGVGAQRRKHLLEQPWTHWRDSVLQEFAGPHPDLLGKVTRIDVTRYGHAMSTPVPGIRGNAALRALQQPQQAAWRRLHFAHSDLAGYSVFEEAFTMGHRRAMALP